MTVTFGDKKAEKHLRDSYNNLKNTGQAEKLELVQGREQIVQLVPQLKDAPNVENWKGFFNGQGGWVHSRKALEKWGTEAEKKGVKFISGPQGTMTGLEVDGDSLVGIKVASGDVLRADRYILSTGAASPEVLPELSQELWSKCWTLGHVELTEEEAAQWKGIPVIDHFELGFTFEPNEETSEITPFGIDMNSTDDF